jgi:hypothetical protein
LPLFHRFSTPAVTISPSEVAPSPQQATVHEMEPGQVTSKDCVDSHANASKEQHEHSNVAPQRGIDTAGAQSYQIHEFCDKDETVMANALQGSERSSGDPANSHTNNTPAVDG